MILNMDISKSAVFHANEHRSDQKNVTNDFRMNFRFVHAKMTVNGMPENVASRWILVFHRI